MSGPESSIYSRCESCVLHATHQHRHSSIRDHYQPSKHVGHKVHWACRSVCNHSGHKTHKNAIIKACELHTHLPCCHWSMKAWNLSNTTLPEVGVHVVLSQWLRQASGFLISRKECRIMSHNWGLIGSNKRATRIWYDRKLFRIDQRSNAKLVRQCK